MITKKVSTVNRQGAKEGDLFLGGLFQMVELGSDIWNRSSSGVAAEPDL
jgi:hypothetical protein